jgi:hypothetical protein
MPSLNPLWNALSKYGQRVPRTTRCAAKGIFDSPRYMVISEYLLLLNKLKCGQHYYANPEVVVSHLSNAVPELEVSPSGMAGAIAVELCVRTFDCGANWQNARDCSDCYLRLGSRPCTDCSGLRRCSRSLSDCSCRRCISARLGGRGTSGGAAS